MPTPVFILCPPRSFSSLACGMLGRHPQLLGMPELNLFLANNLGALMRRHVRRREHGRHGLMRALAWLHHGSQSEEAVLAARFWIEARSDWSTRKVFDHLIQLASPRVLVDKSPSTVLGPHALRRMLSWFPDASLLHITRHPRSTSISLRGLLGKEDGIGPWKKEDLDTERLWLRSHMSIAQLSKELPVGQCMRLRGEDLVAEPERYLPQICQWLGLREDQEAISAMLHPESSPFACLGPPSARYGNDPGFLERPALQPGKKPVEPNMGDEFEWAPGNKFSAATRKLAKEFGYR